MRKIQPFTNYKKKEKHLSQKAKNDNRHFCILTTEPDQLHCAIKVFLVHYRLPGNNMKYIMCKFKYIKNRYRQVIYKKCISSRTKKTQNARPLKSRCSNLTYRIDERVRRYM